MINTTNYGNYWGSSTAAVCNVLSGNVSTTVNTDAVQEELKSKCTDGADDGKLSFGEKVGGFFNGIGNVFKNIAKGFVEDPLGSLAKVAIGVGLVALTAVTGPVGLAASAVVLGMSAYGVCKGVETVVKGGIAAANATTDAEAKAAWENIGSGTFQTVVSAVAAKGAMGAFKANALAVGGKLASTTAGTAAETAAGTAGSTTNTATSLANSGKNLLSKMGTAVTKTKTGLGESMKTFGQSSGGLASTTAKAAWGIAKGTAKFVAKGSTKVSTNSLIRGSALTLSDEAGDTHINLDKKSETIRAYEKYLKQKAESEAYYAQIKQNYGSTLPGAQPSYGYYYS